VRLDHALNFGKNLVEARNRKSVKAFARILVLRARDELDEGAKIARILADVINDCNGVCEKQTLDNEIQARLEILGVLEQRRQTLLPGNEGSKRESFGALGNCSLEHFAEGSEHGGNRLGVIGADYLAEKSTKLLHNRV